MQIAAVRVSGLWGGFRGAHGPVSLGVVGVSGFAGEASDIG